MAAIPVTIVGIDQNGNPTTIVGMMSYTGLGVGGGPIMPPEPGKPPGIWGGGNVPMPTPPIANVPGLPPTQNPPGWGLHPAHPIVLPPIDPGGPPIDIGAHPEHPIVLPPMPEPPQPPETVTVLKAPPPTGGWGAVSEYGWAYYPGTGAAGPKA